MLDADGLVLRARLLELFQQPIDSPLPDDAFNDAALRIFRYQFERNLPFGAFCRRRARTPEHVSHWTEIPAVPAAAFREIALVAGHPDRAEAVFRTSGTTQRGRRRGTHYVLDLSLYHGSLLPNFAARLLPDGIAPLMLALVPPPSELPDSSLSHMIGVVMEQLGAPDSTWLAHVETGLDLASLTRTLRRAEDQARAVCLLGTSFSFVHWTDHLRDAGDRFRLPTGSRLMDTGGYKGRSREVPEDVLREAYTELLALEPESCVNEYGMTELCSQYYDSLLYERVKRGGAGRRRKLGPPWMRARIVDPDTLQPVRGGVGLLQHIDLANLSSVLVVQTEDLGRAEEDGFIVLGRSQGATPRGCSIAMDDLLEVARRTAADRDE